MLNVEKFGLELKKAGFCFYSGVPCSFLKPLMNFAINNCDYVMASNEGDALAICAGYSLTGKHAVVLMQNSGLSNAISPLTSLNYTFQIPVLGFVSLRGERGLRDEPQHELMGEITTRLLDTMKLDWDYLATTENESNIQICRASEYLNKGKSFFFIVRKGTFSECNLDHCKKEKGSISGVFKSSPLIGEFTRFQVLKIIQKNKSNKTIFLSTTGKTSRELYEINDLPNNLYVVGSMGCVASLGLGLALARPEIDVIVIDGDGSLLMRMGVMATLGYYSPRNLMHILLDNNCYDSTGGQATVSGKINFVKVAEGCGYGLVYSTKDILELDRIIKDWRKIKKLAFVYFKILRGSKKNLGRPKIKPFEVRRRFMRFLQEDK